MGTTLARLNPRAGHRPVAPLLFPWAPLGDALRRFGGSTSDWHTRMASYKESAVMQCALRERVDVFRHI
jgi:hypothetical protein